MKEKEEHILGLLLYLSFNIKHNGTIYLFEAIKIIMKCKNKSYCNNLEKNIYPILAKKYSTSTHNIKSNILKAINIMYQNCEISKLTSFFSLNMDMKPTPKMIISTLLNYS